MIDRIIGERVTTARLAAGLSLDQLARALSLTCGDLERIETGEVRLSAGLLISAAVILHCPPGSLLLDLPETPANPPGKLRLV